MAAAYSMSEDIAARFGATAAAVAVAVAVCMGSSEIVPHLVRRVRQQHLIIDNPPDYQQYMALSSHLEIG
jgi:hypothetical protein